MSISPNAPTTRLEINLSALSHNYRRLRAKLDTGTKFLAVVKADAYGSSDVPVAKHLESLGVDYFGVVFIREGVTLRKAGIQKPILVFHPLEADLPLLEPHRLEPAIYNDYILKAFVRRISSEPKTPIHLKFNTGLNRLGFSPDEAVEIIRQVKSIGLKINGIYSHLAASEDLNEKEFTLNQIRIFKQRVLEPARSLLEKPFLAHILNTSGIFNYADIAQLDMVRSGIGLYGFGNDARHSAELRPIGGLKTRISQILNLQKGDSVGYNRALTVAQGAKIAVLPIGHADGINRIYGRGHGFVFINGHRAAIVGNVCMDMIMVDVSEISCTEGDEAVIFGEGHTAEDLASHAGSISYELITGIGPRVSRVIVSD